MNRIAAELKAEKEKQEAIERARLEQAKRDKMYKEINEVKREYKAAKAELKSSKKERVSLRKMLLKFEAFKRQKLSPEI